MKIYPFNVFGILAGCAIIAMVVVIWSTESWELIQAMRNVK